MSKLTNIENLDDATLGEINNSNKEITNLLNYKCESCMCQCQNNNTEKYSNQFNKQEDLVNNNHNSKMSNLDIRILNENSNNCIQNNKNRNAHNNCPLKYADINSTNQITTNSSLIHQNHLPTSHTEPYSFLLNQNQKNTNSNNNACSSSSTSPSTKANSRSASASKVVSLLLF